MLARGAHAGRRDAKERDRVFMIRTCSRAWVYRTMCIGLLCLVRLPSAEAEQSNLWTAHTSSRAVLALSATEDAIWAATSGGVFRYRVSTGELKRYTAAEGLHDVQSRAIVYDERRKSVWTGYADGVIDRLDVETGHVSTFFDIQRSERFPAGEIHRLEVMGDTLFVATSFGLVLFDPVRDEVRDTYSQLGSFTPATAVYDIDVAPIPDGRIGLWLASDEGVAFAALGAENLQDPSAWSVDRSVRPSSKVSAIAEFEGRIYVGTERGLGRRESDGSYTQYSFTSRRILDLAVLGDRLLVIDKFKLYAAFASGGSLLQVDGFLGLNAVVVGSDETIWIGDAEVGLNHYERPTGNIAPAPISREIYPDGPFDSPFGDLTVDQDGSLWAAAVEGATGAGFYRLDAQGQWTNFTRRFRSELEGKGSFLRVHADMRGNVWAASVGAGLAQVSSDGAITVHDHSNSSLRPAAGTATYVIVGGASSDKDGALWVTNTIAPQPLHVRGPHGEWTGLPAPVCGGLALTTALGPIFVDSSDIKWIVVLETGDLRHTRGVLALDTGATPTDPGDDECQFYGETGSNGTGLPSTEITAVTEDGAGLIWIGTDAGPAYFLSGAFAAIDGSTTAAWPVWSDRNVASYVLRGLSVNDIAVDPSNRLWMATNEGAYLIEERSGFELVERYAAHNSPLFSDVVSTIAVDGSTGRIFFGTDKGLLSYLSDAIDPVETKRDLFIYPNPVLITSGADPEIFIEGLVEETEISIVAIHGELVTRFQTRGGRVRWNGRGRNGELVPSGVYVVVAVGKNGEGAAYGKVAVIR